ncbi:MAG: hypothetical protein ACKESB_01140 [Candidatus Hodgkinia cicadicola]
MISWMKPALRLLSKRKLFGCVSEYGERWVCRGGKGKGGRTRIGLIRDKVCWNCRTGAVLSEPVAFDVCSLLKGKATFSSKVVATAVCRSYNLQLCEAMTSFSKTSAH